MRVDSLFFAALMLTGCSLAGKNPSPEMSSNKPAQKGPPARRAASTYEACPQWQDLFLVPGQPKENTLFDPKSPQVKIINQSMATRSHRVSHALWHAVRGGLSTNDRQQVMTAFGNIWSESHRLCPPDSGIPNGASNSAGEDFLFMHRQMINELREEMASSGVACIPPFQNYEDIKNWPVPKGSKKVGPKADSALSEFQRWDNYFQDSKWLASHTLSQVGFALEFTIHNNLHMRFATDRPARAFRAAQPEDDGAQIPFDGHFPADWKYDDPGYNWLADPYGAAVNPVFWKIHGYVDAVIDRWLSAHGFENISEDCTGLEKCYQWKGTWTGMVAGDHDKAMPGMKHPTTASPSQSSARDVAKATKDFNRRRMKFQWLGVLPPPSPRAMPIKAPPPQDPLEEATQKVCSPSP